MRTTRFADVMAVALLVMATIAAPGPVRADEAAGPAVQGEVPIDHNWPFYVPRDEHRGDGEPAPPEVVALTPVITIEDVPGRGASETETDEDAAANSKAQTQSADIPRPSD